MVDRATKNWRERVMSAGKVLYGKARACSENRVGPMYNFAQVVT